MDCDPPSVFLMWSFGQIAHSCVVELQAELQLYYSHTKSVKVTSAWFRFADSLAGTGKSDCSFWYLLALTTSSFPVLLWSLSPPIHANLQTLSTSKNDAYQRNSCAPKYSLGELGARLQSFLSSLQLSLWNSLLVGGLLCVTSERCEPHYAHSVHESVWTRRSPVSCDITP